MKLKRMVWGGLLAVSITQISFAQPDPMGAGYTIVRRGPNDRVWEKVDPAIPGKTNSFVEVASGLHHWSGSEFLDSQDLIEITREGAAAIHGQCKAFFSGNLNSPDAIRLETESRVYKTRPLGLFYFDTASQKAVRIASIDDCSGELLPPNQVVWKAIFGPKPALQADLRVTYSKAAIETDFILLESPQPPESFGLDPLTTKLELWHEWEGAPTPNKREVVLDAEDFTDELLDFGDLFFPRGRGFMALAADPVEPGKPASVRIPDFEDANSLPVAKEWHVIDGRSVLIERMQWRELKTQLSPLPKNRGSAKAGGGKERLLCLRELPAAGGDEQERSLKTIELAASPYAPQGFIWDYITVSGSGHYTFSSNETYWLSGMGYFGGTVTFHQRCVLKFDDNANLLLYGNVVCWGTSANPTVLTSEDEDVPTNLSVPGGVGEVLPFSTHLPTYRASPAICLYWMSSSQTLRGLKIRWAKTALKVEGYTAHSLTDSSIQLSQTGTYLSQCSTFTVSASTKCSVMTEAAGSTECYTGALTDLCAGQTDSDSDGLPNWWEYKYFGDNIAMPGTDSDADGSTNLAEYQAGTVPINYPSFTQLPQYRVIQVGASTTLSVAGSAPGLTYTWFKNALPTGITGPSVNISNARVVEDTAPWVVRASSPLHIISAMGVVSVGDSWGMGGWTHLCNSTNSRTPNLFSSQSHPPGWPTTYPVLVWDANGLLYNRPGFTAISGCNTFENMTDTFHGQCRVTALTRRHGYLRGHGMGSQGKRTDWDGKKVWFCKPNGEVYEAVVDRGYVRLSDGPPRIDYTIVLFKDDLPAEITPLRVINYPWVGTYVTPVYFRVCQHNYVSANEPLANPLPLGERPPFNDHITYVAGDSGSPNLLLTPAGELIFRCGSNTTGASTQMQVDMNDLSDDIGLIPSNYQLQWYPVDWF